MWERVAYCLLNCIKRRKNKMWYVKNIVMVYHPFECSVIWSHCIATHWYSALWLFMQGCNVSVMIWIQNVYCCRKWPIVCTLVAVFALKIKCWRVIMLHSNINYQAKKSITLLGIFWGYYFLLPPIFGAFRIKKYRYYQPYGL